MDYRIIVTTWFLFVFSMISCTDKNHFDSFGDEADNRFLSIEVRIGTEYFLKKLGFLPSNHTPQVVVWMEDDKGDFIDTIYMTRTAANGNWDDGDIERPSCFPVWSYKRGIETTPGYYMPTRDNPLTDAVTSATPQNNFRISRSIPSDLKYGFYTINMEVNSSYDYNDTYTNKDPGKTDYHPFNGQPSIVWSGKIEINREGSEAGMHIIGHGDNDGKTGTIAEDLGRLTSAKKIIESVIVSFHP